MGKSSFQRDDDSTEGTSSLVLGQGLEHELFPHPLKMSRSTFCPGVISSCASTCVPGVHVECIWMLLQLDVLSGLVQDVLLSKSQNFWVHLGPGTHLTSYRHQQREGVLALRLCSSLSGHNFIDQIWLVNNSVKLNTVKNSLFSSEFSVQCGRHRLINEIFLTAFRSAWRGRFRPL